MSESTICAWNRPSGREDNQLRGISIERGFTRHAPGSVLISCGDTRVICTASVEARTPPWMRNNGNGWVTGEYSMLPGATHRRGAREAARGRQSGRTQEIQRLIGRSLRAVTDLAAIAGHTITLDCDVIQADGGTRTAAITGAYVALVDAVRHMRRREMIKTEPIHGQAAAVSVGIYRGRPVLDLDYAEDSAAETDMNVVMNEGGGFIEIQGTAEGHPFQRAEMDRLMDMAGEGIQQLLEQQRQALADDV